MSNVLLGGAIGDALGVPFEKKLVDDPLLVNWDGRSFLGSEHHKLLPGQYSDDTQLSIEVAESLIANNGFNPDDLAARYVDWMVSGRARGWGRMLDLETELPTPNGFIKLKDLKEGAQLFDDKGNICNVIQLHPINMQPDSYQITFDDGTIVNACADHLWLTWDKKARSNKQRNRKINNLPLIRSTKEIINTLKVSYKKETNHSIQNTKPINYNSKKLIIDPYLLGLWLGDGSSKAGRIETADIDVLINFNYKLIKVKYDDKKSKSRPYTIYGLQKNIKKLNLFGNKHIPDIYLYASYKQRLALLQGLMDSDGCCNKNGQFEFCSTLEILAEQTYQLMTSLGIKAKITKGISSHYNKKYGTKYMIRGITKLPIFRLKRKLINLKKSIAQDTRNTHRYITNIKHIKSIPMRCITVDSPSHLYLITKSFIPTHNTTLLAIQNLQSGKHWSESGVAGSEGNGTAMRSAPFGVYFRNDLKSLVHICKIDSAITHASPEAEAGSIAIAVAAYYAVNNDTDDLLNKICEHLPNSKVKNTIYSLDNLVTIKHITPVIALKILGTKANVRETVPSALYCFLKFDNYYDAVLAAIRAGGDTDTTAAIVGALFGARDCVKVIDKSFYKIEDFDKLVALDSKLYNRSTESFFPRN
jgi:ADP-ribosylglycohydrolase